MNMPEPREYEAPEKKPAPVVSPSGSHIKEEPELELAEDTAMQRRKKQMGYKQFKVNTLKIKGRGGK